MRVTLPLKYDRMVNDLNRKSSDLSRLSAQASSGKRLARPSDDPLGWVRSMSIKSGLHEMDRFKSNIDYATHWNRATENTLGELSELFMSAKETAIAAMGAPSGEPDHAHMQKLDQIFEQALSIANTRHENRFLFAVNNRESPFSLGSDDQVLSHGPKDSLNADNSFSMKIGHDLSQEAGLGSILNLFYLGDENASPPNTFTAAQPVSPIGTGTTGSIHVNGHEVSFDGGGDKQVTAENFRDAVNDDSYLNAAGITASVEDMGGGDYRIILDAADGRAISVSAGDTEVGVLGFTEEKSKASIFDPGSLQVLLDLKKAISEKDADGITEQMGNLDKILDNVNRQRSLAGNRLATLEVREMAMETLALEEQIRLSKVEDADMFATIADLQAKTTTFEAALKVTGMLSGLNLTQYV